MASRYFFGISVMPFPRTLKSCKVVCITSAGIHPGERIIRITAARIDETAYPPEYLMSKGEYTKLLKYQEKQGVDAKKHTRHLEEYWKIKQQKEHEQLQQNLNTDVSSPSVSQISIKKRIVGLLCRLPCASACEPLNFSIIFIAFFCLRWYTVICESMCTKGNPAFLQTYMIGRIKA